MILVFKIFLAIVFSAAYIFLAMLTLFWLPDKSIINIILYIVLVPGALVLCMWFFALFAKRKGRGKLFGFAILITMYHYILCEIGAHTDKLVLEGLGILELIFLVWIISSNRKSLYNAGAESKIN